jgi:hypothetical protein
MKGGGVLINENPKQGVLINYNHKLKKQMIIKLKPNLPHTYIIQIPSIEIREYGRRDPSH